MIESNPSKKNIYIVRHGETDYNLRHIVQGSGVDSDLNKKGLLQSKAFYDAYKHIHFDKIYTSTLKRTHQTVLPFLNQNFPWEQHPGLNEISWGEREGKVPDYLDNIQFGHVTRQWHQGQTEVNFKGGESPNQVAARQNIFLEKMLSKSEEKNILIAMHGRALKIFLANVLNQDLSKMDQYDHSNLCLYLLEYNYHTNHYKMVIRKDTSHLIGIN